MVTRVRDFWGFLELFVQYFDTGGRHLILQVIIVENLKLTHTSMHE